MQEQSEIISKLEAIAPSVTIKADKDIPDLLTISSGDIPYETGIQENHLIIQDKASCIPPFLLKNYLPNAKELTIIDACASPGNKTLQLLEHFGRVVAVEKDIKRYDILVKRLEKYGGKATKVINTDFKTISPEEISDADFILIDTSCSGTGNLDIAENNASLKQALSKCILKADYSKIYDTLQLKLKNKIKRLSKFQKEILKSALSWKNIKGVAYSTCSVFPEENEEVVKEALESSPDFRLADFPSSIGHPGFIVLLPIQSEYRKAQFECALNAISRAASL